MDNGSCCLPLVLLVEILLLLPASALLKFKRVSKEWFCIIESSAFVNDHLNHNSEKMDLICTNAEHEMYILSGRRYEESLQLNLEDMFSLFFGIYNSCNGIVLCEHMNMSHDDLILSMWNPVTNKCRHIPLENSDRDAFNNGSVSFALNFDKRKNEYKIVSIATFLCEICVVQLYSIKTKSWKTIHHGDLPVEFISTDYEVACNDELALWAGGNLGEVSTIVYFDWADEMYGMLPLPKDIDCGRVVPAFINKKVSCLQWFVDDAFSLDIWVMEEFGNQDSWAKICHFECNIQRVNGVKLSQNGEKFFMMLQDKTYNGLYSVDVDTVTREPVHIPAPRRPTFLYHYIGSLVSV